MKFFRGFLEAKSEEPRNETKEQETQSAEVLRPELTEKQIKKRLSKLGDIKELAKNVSDPFQPYSIEALARLVIKVESDLPSYDTVLSDEASGRLPSLFLSKIINHVRLKNGQDSVQTYFIATGRHHNPEKEKAIKEFLVSKKDKIGKALVVAEYISTGTGIGWLIETMKMLGINFDTAAVSIDKENDIIKNNHICYGTARTDGVFGALVGGLEFYDHLASGVVKNRIDPSPHPEVRHPNSRYFINRARKDLDFLAKEFIDKLLG